MKILIDSIEINGTDRNGHIEADVEFYDVGQVIEDLGMKDAIEQHGEEEILNEIGWAKVKEYFADEIQEAIDEAKES